jgi:4-hydroxy-tetrahydrodipicolinate synthase
MSTDQTERRLPAGVFPVMLTPLTGSYAVDYAALEDLTEWYLDAGVAGLFAVSQSSEMHALTDQERLDVARAVVEAAGDRVPIVATGTFEGSIDEQAAFVDAMGETGVDAVVANVSRLAGRAESDREWRARAECLLDATDAPLGLYECPAPYHRLLSTDLLEWITGTGRFHFLKDTCSDPGRLQERLGTVEGTPVGLYNANAPTLLGSLREGARGYSGTLANFIPDLLVWLCENYGDEPETAAELQRFLSVADRIAHYKYPPSAKRYGARFEVEMTTASRLSNASLSASDERTLEDLYESACGWRERLDLN